MNIIASSQLTIIIGLGVTGLSCARFLQRNNINFMLVDSRDNPPNLDVFVEEFPGVSYSFGSLDASLLSQANEIIISPGMSLQTPELQPAIKAGVSIIGDIELFARYVQKPVIAITGSNAKSTVTTLVGEMLKASGVRVAVGGNLGVPVLELLDNDVDFFVLELSSFQLETTFSLKPRVATVLNISSDHMDRHHSLADYHKIKQRVYRGAEQVVINRQDVLTQPLLAKGVKVWSFGEDTSDINGFGLLQKNDGWYLSFQFETIMKADDLPVKGKHNYVNALAALALGSAAGLKLAPMIKALKGFEGLPHRCEHIRTINQVMYINDSKATNVGAAVAAIQGFSVGKKNIILIAGGDGKEADFSPLRLPVEKYVRVVILIGRDANQIASVLNNDIVTLLNASSLPEAVTKARECSQVGDIVLLSPACASFDMFSSFEERGHVFSEAVQELAA